MTVNTCILRLRKGKKKKDYHFESVANAAIFEETFLSHENTKNKVRFELIHDEVEETMKLMQELGRNPKRYGEKEYLKYFGVNDDTKENIKAE